MGKFEAFLPMTFFKPLLLSLKLHSQKMSVLWDTLVQTEDISAEVIYFVHGQGTTCVISSTGNLT